MVDTCLSTSITRDPTPAERAHRQAWELAGGDDSVVAPVEPDFIVKHPYVTAVIAASADIRAERVPLFSEADLYGWVFDAVLEHSFDTAQIDWRMRAMARA